MKKFGESHVFWDNFIYIVFTVLFFIFLFQFVTGYRNGASLWEDLYAKEIATVINRAEPGSEIKLDISRLTSVAAKTGKDLKDVVVINNVDNSVTVSLRNGAGMRYNFFNDVDIIEPRIELSSGGATVNQLILKVSERKK